MWPTGPKPAMNQMEKHQQFDIDRLRRKVRQGSGGDATAAPEGSGKINALARQVANHLSEGNYSPAIIIGQMRLFEFLCLLALGLGTFYFAADASTTNLWADLTIVVLASGATVLMMQIADSYQVPALRAPLRSVPRIWGSFMVAMVVSALVLFLAGDHALAFGDWLIAWFVVGSAFLLTERVLFGFRIRQWARNGVMERRAVIVGGGQPAKDLIRALEMQPDNDIRICGIFDDRGTARSPTVVAGYPKLGTFAELVEFARLARIDMLIIALPLSAEERILHLLRKLWVLPVDIRLAAHSNSLRFRPRAYSHVGAVPMLDIMDKPIRDWDSVAKRVFDITFSLLALAVLWPVMVAAAIAVKATSKGPVFFIQERHGFNNEIIRVLKFRSMYTEMSDPTARQAVTKNDPRVTPVGRFLRKSSIDELPQFVNVLKGNLSLVGPRPHAVLAQTRDRKYSEIVEGYFARHRVKPGVTGWAQINGLRGEVDTDEKIKLRTAYDLYYIENWSLFLDLKILFLTPFRLLNTENAY